MNGVKGTALTLAQRRGRKSVLEVALDQNKIDQATLDALLGAIRESFPIFRRYLRSKAKKLGQEQLAWWDLFAPLGSAHRTFTWQQARDFIVEKFNRFTPDLGQFAATGFRPALDRRPAARRQTRRGVLLGRHGHRSKPHPGQLRRQLRAGEHAGPRVGARLSQRLPERPVGPGRGAPMTLAETASIFCETLIAEAALEQADADERLMILEAQLAGATQVCVDISSRFLFESEVFRRRADSELSADEFCEVMLAAQKETYGDSIRRRDLSSLHVAVEAALLQLRDELLQLPLRVRPFVRPGAICRVSAARAVVRAAL